MTSTAYRRFFSKARRLTAPTRALNTMNTGSSKIAPKASTNRVTKLTKRLMEMTARSSSDWKPRRNLMPNGSVTRAQKAVPP